MKKTTSPILLVTLFISLCSGICSKKSNDLPLSEYYPQYWIFTIDEAPDKYTFLRTNGANLFRKSVLKSYNLVTLANEEDCKWEISQSRNEANNDDCFEIRLEKDKKVWMGASPSSNKLEIHARTLNYSGIDPGDGYKFKIHKLPDVNGVKMIAIESVYHKGYYISSQPPGSQFAQNQVTLQQASSPQKATAWACR